MSSYERVEYWDDDGRHKGVQEVGFWLVRERYQIVLGILVPGMTVRANDGKVAHARAHHPISEEVDLIPAWFPLLGQKNLSCEGLICQRRGKP